MWLPLAGTAGRAPRLKCPSFVKIAYIATALERMMLRIGLGPSVRWGFTPTAVSNHLVAVGDLPFLKIPYTATTLEKTAIRMDQGPSVRWVQLVRWGFTPTAISNRVVTIGWHSIPYGEALHCCLDKYDCLHIIRGYYLQVRGRHRGLPLRKPPFPQTQDVGVTPRGYPGTKAGLKNAIRPSFILIVRAGREACPYAKRSQSRKPMRMDARPIRTVGPTRTAGVYSHRDIQSFGCYRRPWHLARGGFALTCPYQTLDLAGLPSVRGSWPLSLL